jgi:hypothetical protein
MTEPAPEQAETTEPEKQQPPSGDEQIKTVQTRFEAEQRLRKKLEKELTQLRTSQLTESEKAVEEAKAVGRKEGARSVGARLAAAEFRARAAEAKLPSISSLLEVMDLSRFVDENGEPDAEVIQETIDKIREGLAAAENGRSKPKTPEVPKGVRPALGEEDWIRSVVNRAE